MDIRKAIVGSTDTVRELLTIYAAIVGVASVGFSIAEHKPILDSIWWACVTAMTVGYGDMYPVTLAGRAIAILLMHIVPLFVIPLFIARVLGKIVEDRNAFTHEEQEEIKNLLRRVSDKLDNH